MENQVKSEHYSFNSYLPKDRWCSYWHQIDEVLKSSPSKVLLIGKGDGIVGKILNDIYSINVRSFDYAEDLKPDYKGDIRCIESIIPKGEKFDTIICCQVLEHIHFEDFESVIASLYNITGKYFILSLPHINWSFRILIRLFNKQISKQLIFNRKNVRLCFDGQHYWEIGSLGCSVNKVENILKKYFVIERVFNVREKSYHRFYILKKV